MTPANAQQAKTFGGDQTPTADVDLSPQELAVWMVLVERRGRVVSRSELSRRAGLGELHARRCDSLIVGIRRSVGPDRIVTIRRRGWMLVA